METSKRKTKNDIHEQYHQRNGRDLDSIRSTASIKGKKELD